MLVPLSYYYVTEAMLVAGFITGVLMLAIARLRPGRPGTVLIGLTIVLGLVIGLLRQKITMCCDMYQRTHFGYPFDWLTHDDGWTIDAVHLMVDVFAWAGAGLAVTVLFRLVRPASRAGEAQIVKAP